MATRPTDYLDWGGTQVQPTSGQKSTGFVPNFRPPSQWHNWMFFIIDQWVKWFDQEIQGFVGYSKIYDAFVGTGPLATHADLNAAMLDVPAGGRILVISSATINTIQSISKNRVQVDFQPGVIYTKGLATSALQIQAKYVRVNSGEFFNFSGGGDNAIIIDAASDFTKIRDSHFRTCTTAVQDNTSTSSIEGTTEEA